MVKQSSQHGSVDIIRSMGRKDVTASVAQHHWLPRLAAKTDATVLINPLYLKYKS